MLKKAAALFLVGVSIAIWVGCGTTSSHYLYAAIPTLNQIVAFREDPISGVLTPLAGSPFAAGTDVHSIAIHPSKKFMYAANSFDSTISLFTIDNFGALTEVTPRTATGTSPRFIVMDPAGSFLYVGNIGENGSLWSYSIDSSSGALTQVGTFQLGTIPLNMAVLPSTGAVLYVTGAGSGGSQGFIEVLGLTAGVATSFKLVTQVGGVNPDGLAIDPGGKYLYVANSAPDNSISAFAISSSDGSLTELSGSPLGETYASPVALLVDKSDKYLYVANEGSANVAAYSIASTGGLTLLTNSPFGTSSQPAFIATDPSGTHLFVGNQISGATIESFSLDSGNGTLTEVQTYSVGNAPTSIAVTP